MSYRYIFTVTAGRSGQFSLSEILTRYVPRCVAAFEEPQANPVLPFPFKTLERSFRRRFVQTHELLGRGQVLQAFERGDTGYLESIARRRLKRAHRKLGKSNAEIYFDVSKFYARGLHLGFAAVLPKFGLLRLMRDPIRNMRSFLNRGKHFSLDNGSPAASVNQLRLDPSNMRAEDLYLWAWCEMYLRYDWIADRWNASPRAELRTEDLTHPARVAKVLSSLGLDHATLSALPAGNTNESQGFQPTRLTRADIEAFEAFRDRLPADIRRRIGYFDDYDPWRANELQLAEMCAPQPASS